MLQDRMQVTADSFVARRKYIASFLSHFGSALLEYDVENFSRISFLFEVRFSCEFWCAVADK
eukprot:m.666093 g.666093  ORF g.666093 m.666093 type:complete len:62 (-) comp22748_c0_seq47:1254-1439(-)